LQTDLGAMKKWHNCFLNHPERATQRLYYRRKMSVRLSVRLSIMPVFCRNG